MLTGTSPCALVRDGAPPNESTLGGAEGGKVGGGEIEAGAMYKTGVGRTDRDPVPAPVASNAGAPTTEAGAKGCPSGGFHDKTVVPGAEEVTAPATPDVRAAVSARGMPGA
jgi:hypothetical protein